MVIISKYEMKTSRKDGRTRVINRGPEPICPICGRTLEYGDERQRVYKMEVGEKEILFVRRLRCRRCGKLHVELPDFLEANRQYIIWKVVGVLKRQVTYCTNSGIRRPLIK